MRNSPFFLNVAPFAEAKFMFIIGPPISKNTKTIPPVLYKLKLMIQKYKTLDTFRHISHVPGFFFQIPQAGPLARILNIS
jgi:hypothetical protein